MLIINRRRRMPQVRVEGNRNGRNPAANRTGIAETELLRHNAIIGATFTADAGERGLNALVRRLSGSPIHRLNDLTVWLPALAGRLWLS
jgi:hypothetical protein